MHIAITLIVFYVLISISLSFDTLQLAWSTDLVNGTVLPGVANNGIFGYDGPWQAPVIKTWNANESESLLLLLPTASCITTLVFTTAIGGPYNLTEGPPTSRNAHSANFSSTLVQQEWSVWKTSNQSSMIIEGVPGNVSAMLPLRGSTWRLKEHSLPIFAISRWKSLKSRKPVQRLETGILCLGRSSGRSSVRPSTSPDGSDQQLSLLESLKAERGFQSLSFGLHIGSVILNQSGSLVLGGYDPSRALGPVGVWNFQGRSEKGHEQTIAFLSDVLLGVESGMTPFNQTNDISIYRPGPTSIHAWLDGPAGSAPVLVNSLVPYLYLPFETCQAAASFLPVLWDPKSRLYLWDIGNPQYRRIMTSPSYLAFILTDRSNRNITIKAPFQLLNLSLGDSSAPIQKPYFPCRSSRWTNLHLGRAFLQAAYFSVNHDKGVFFLAQAPGPSVKSTMGVEIDADSTSLSTGNISEFKSSWQSHWTDLTESSAPSTGSGKQGLSVRSVAGIAAGSVASFVILLVTAAIFVWQRAKKRRARLLAASPKSLQNELANTHMALEVPATGVHEVPRSPVPQQIDPSGELCEAPTTSEWPPELSSSSKAQSATR